MLVYLFDGTLDGLLSCVFESYVQKEIPDSVIEEEYLQLGFDQQIRMIDTNAARSLRVENGLRRTAGEEAYELVWMTFLSQEIDKAFLMRYIHACFTYGQAVLSMLAHPDVNPVMKAQVNIGMEAHHLRGFVRFAKMENGVYFSRISPKNSVVPLLMPHFADRFPDQPFLLFDSVHSLAGIYPLDEWYMVEVDDIDLPPEDAGEAEWKAMWRQFYKAVSIRERESARRRKNMCPMRFWENMVEMRGE